MGRRPLNLIRRSAARRTPPGVVENLRDFTTPREGVFGLEYRKGKGFVECNVPRTTDENNDLAVVKEIIGANPGTNQT